MQQNSNSNSNSPSVSPTPILINRTNIYHGQAVPNVVVNSKGPNAPRRSSKEDRDGKTSPIMTPEKYELSPNRTDVEKYSPHSLEKRMQVKNLSPLSDKHSPNHSPVHENATHPTKLVEVKETSPTKIPWSPAQPRKMTSSPESSPTVTPEKSPIANPNPENTSQYFTPYRPFSQSVRIEKHRTFASDPPTFRKPPKPKEIETDPHRLAQRQKQIDFGYNSPGYQRYVTLVFLFRFLH